MDQIIRADCETCTFFSAWICCNHFFPNTKLQLHWKLAINLTWKLSSKHAPLSQSANSGAIFRLLHGGCTSSVVRESEFKSEDPGFNPLAGQGEGQVFLSLRVDSCADLFVPDLPSCVWHAPKFMRTLKILYPSVVKSRPLMQKNLLLGSPGLSGLILSLE